MLSKEQVSQYAQKGYTIQPSFLNKSEINAMLADIESICAGATLVTHNANRIEMEPKQNPEGTLVRRVYEPCTYYPQFRSFSESTRVLDCVQQVLGRHLCFHYSKLNVKPPSIGSVVEWHQDLAYYPLTNNDSLAILIYLDDAARHNGCLRVIPSRHVKPLMDHTAAGFFQGKITEPIDESQAVSLEGGRGTAIFMHGMTPHSSAPNSSLEPRRTLILSYRAGDAFPIYTGDQTEDFEAHVRHVRGQPQSVARFSSGNFPIPRFPGKIKSLYELQDLSRGSNAQSNQPT